MRKQVLVSADRGETRVAILESKGSPPAKSGTRKRSRKRPLKADPKTWRVAELYIERRGRRSIVGNIYKGVVDNVLSGMEAAFVDIGLEKNGFLHVDEIVTEEGESIRRGRGRSGGPRISSLLKAKQEVVVQVTKDPIGTKGARLSMQLAIPGRYLVYAPFGEGVGVSRRLSDSERERLRKMAAGLKLKKAGLIVRTAADGARKADMERELQYLFKLNEVLESRVAESAAPSMVFQEADLPVRVLRDVFTKEFDRAIIDNEPSHHRVKSFFERTAPDLLDDVELYTEEEPLMQRLGVEEAFQSTLSRRVELPHGGYLMIDHAEALTVIDVNTGSYTGRGRGSLEDTIVKVNLQAAEEVVRQLRLRDIGGIIVIDFIDMAYTRNRNQVLSVLRSALDEDRTRTHVVEISPLGLVEMTRQNVTEGVREIMTRPCPTCEGEGVILAEETVAIEVERKVRDLAKQSKAEAFLLQVHPRVAAILIGGGGKPLRELEQETGKVFHFEGTDGIPLDSFSVSLEGTQEEVEKRALPFEQGEEVLIGIEEPHMYNVDDAIARIDGYVVSVAGGGPFVGEKKLIRIDEVKRTAAYASLLSEDGEPLPRPAKKDKPAEKDKPAKKAEKDKSAKKAEKDKPAKKAEKDKPVERPERKPVKRERKPVKRERKPARTVTTKSAEKPDDKWAERIDKSAEKVSAAAAAPKRSSIRRRTGDDAAETDSKPAKRTRSSTGSTGSKADGTTKPSDSTPTTPKRPSIRRKSATKTGD